MKLRSYERVLLNVPPLVPKVKCTAILPDTPETEMQRIFVSDTQEDFSCAVAPKVTSNEN